MTSIRSRVRRFRRLKSQVLERGQGIFRGPESALEHWSRRYAKTWDFKRLRADAWRTGDIVGSNALYVRSSFRIEEYTILDALLRHLIDRKGRVKVLDVACGKGLACFFIAANRERYDNKVEYLGIDSSEAQLYAATLRNPWSFAEFRLGNLFDIGLPPDQFDLVLNWQTICHVGRIRDSLQQLNRVSRGIVYIINYAYFDNKKFAELHGKDKIEAEWGDLAWAFNRDSVVAFIDSLGVHQCWRVITDPSFGRSFPSGSTSEHTLLIKDRDRDLIRDWEDLHFDETWRENIIAL